MIPYGKQSIDKADVKRVIGILQSDWLTQGPVVGKFEEALCEYTGAKYAVAVSSGTAALHIACLSAGIGNSDEVITSSLTFLASANAILYAKGKPIFADIQQDTGNIDPLEIHKKITKKTKAIIPVHFAGHPCDLKEIKDIARKNKLIVIEDAAHAIGSEYKNSKIGACKYSDMTIFSFHPVKTITTGEGGAVLTNDKAFYEKLLMFRSHGVTKDKKKFKAKNMDLNGGWYYEMHSLGFNYRITDFQCALGLSQLEKLNKFVERRRVIAGIYLQKLSCIEGINSAVEKSYVKSAYHLFCIFVKNQTKRKIVFEKLRKLGVGCQVHYMPVYLHPYYKGLGYKKGLCPNAENFYQKEISIPMYPSLKKTEVIYVIDQLKKVFNEGFEN